MDFRKIKDFLTSDSSKQIIKYLCAVIASIAIIFVIFKLTIPKLINANTSRAVDGLLPVAVLILTIMIVNKLLFTFSLEWLKKILMKSDNFISYIAPVTGDLKLRNYYADFQYELGNEFTFPGIIGIFPVIASLLSTIANLNFIRVAIVEGLEYFTDELGLAFLLALIAYVLLLNTRALALAGFISSCKDRVYMATTNLYTKLPMVTSVIWVVYFVIALLIPPLRSLVQIPAINLITVIVPILILPFLEYHGVKQVSRDITSRYDMEAILKNAKQEFYKASSYSKPQQGYVSPEYQNYQNQGYQEQGYLNQNQGYQNQGYPDQDYQNQGQNHYQNGWWNN